MILFYSKKNFTTTQKSDRIKHAVMKGIKIGILMRLGVFVEMEYKLL